MIKTPQVRLTLSLFTAIFLLIAVLSAADGTDAGPLTLARTKQYDLHSKINGQTYRIMVTTPRGNVSGRIAGYAADLSAVYPVLYVLDGDAMFATAKRECY